jgi:hypothetical protein
MTTALGGPDEVSPQRAALLRVAAQTALLLEVVDAYIAAPDGLGHPVNRGRRALHPVIVQRVSLADALSRQLQAIGLERRARRVPSLAEVLAQAKATPSPLPDSALPVQQEAEPVAGAEVQS